MSAGWVYAVRAGWDVCHVARLGEDVALCGQPLPDDLTQRTATSPKGTSMCAGCWDERQRLARAERGWRARRAQDAGAVAVEFALLMALLAPVIVYGADLTVKMLQRQNDWVACAAAMVPGDPWPAVCSQFLADGTEPPAVVPGVPIPEPAPSPEATP